MTVAAAARVHARVVPAGEVARAALPVLGPRGRPALRRGLVTAVRAVAGAVTQPGAGHALLPTLRRVLLITAAAHAPTAPGSWWRGRRRGRRWSCCTGPRWPRTRSRPCGRSSPPRGYSGSSARYTSRHCTESAGAAVSNTPLG